jgi:hypothetical protein
VNIWSAWWIFISHQWELVLARWSFSFDRFNASWFIFLYIFVVLF